MEKSMLHKQSRKRDFQLMLEARSREAARKFFQKGELPEYDFRE